MKKKVLTALTLVSITLYSQAAQAPENEQSHNAQSLEENRAEMTQKSNAEIQSLLAYAPDLEQMLQKAIESLSKEYARHNQELLELMSNSSSNSDSKAITDKQATVKDLEQQQMMRIKQLKYFLDYLEELRYQFQRNNESSTINA